MSAAAPDGTRRLVEMATATRAVIVHYGDAALTRRAVESVLAGTVRPGAIVVVDNGPGRYPDVDPDPRGPVTVVHPGRNTGFAGGVTIGIASPGNGGMDYAWLLNNDAVAEAEALAELLAAQSRAGGRALVSSLVEDERTGQVWSENARFLPWRMESRHRTHATRPTGDAVVDAGPSWRSVPYLPGCSLLLPIDLLRSIDGLDQSFFMYGEDVDLSLRAIRAGYELVTARRSVVVHRTSSGTRTVPRERMVSESCFRLTAKHFPLLLPFALLGALVTGLKRSLFQPDAWSLTAQLEGYRDALRRRGPPLDPPRG